MSTLDASTFEQLVREYLRGEVAWNQVHEFAIELEWQGAAEEIPKGLDDLYFAFLTADERDDSQFRMSRSEMAKLIEQFDEKRRQGG
jgi:hypothetical protein